MSSIVGLCFLVNYVDVLGICWCGQEAKGQGLGMNGNALEVMVRGCGHEKMTAGRGQKT